MKNRSLFLCTLLVNCAIQCMEQNTQPIAQTQTNPWKAIDCLRIEQTLTNNAINYLKNRLEEYKKVDFTPKDMDHINSMSCQITGKPNLLIDNNGHSVEDNKENTFLHVAIHKSDLDVAEWFIKNKCCAYTRNIDHKEPIDLCIEQLLPTAEEKNKKVAYDILDTLISGYEKASFNVNYKKSFLTKILTLELEHKKHGTNFALKDSWIKTFTECSHCKERNILRKCSSYINPSDIYPTIADTQKDNYTHILVQKHLADQLYDFIQKEYVSFSSNNENKNPLDIALEQFQTFIQNHEYPTDIFAERCCFFMLLNYVKKQQGITDFQQCCTKHTI